MESINFETYADTDPPDRWLDSMHNVRMGDTVFINVAPGTQRPGASRRWAST